MRPSRCLDATPTRCESSRIPWPLGLEEIQQQRYSDRMPIPARTRIMAALDWSRARPGGRPLRRATGQQDAVWGTPLDWTVFAGAALVLSLIAALACALPAWQASRLAPIQALRTE